MEHIIEKELHNSFNSIFGTTVEQVTFTFQKTKKEFNADKTLVLFPFLKLLGKKPDEIGTAIGEHLVSKGLISKFSIVGGFLNLNYPESYWIDALNNVYNTEKFGFAAENSKPTIMVEYASPNTNKPLHLGHLRNVFLGYSVAEILKAFGHKVIKTQIVNDRGIHICKSMLAWQKYSPLNEKGERETPANTGMKGDKLVGKYYVEFDKQFNAEAKQIIALWESGEFDGFSEAVQEKFLEFQNAKEGKDDKAVSAINDKIKDLAKNETDILREAKNMLVRWEGRDPEIYLLWTTMNGWVYAGFNETYKRMGVDFDRDYYESETYVLGKDLVNEGLEKGVFYQKEDGSVWIDLTSDGLDHKLLLRSDGTSVYMTQDVGTAVDRKRDYPDLSGIIYTVGNEQEYHFQVLFLILKKLGYDWADSCYHLSYGMVDLPSGKMKSREGTVVDADELMEEVVQSAKEITQERGQIDGMTEAEKALLFEQIGMGGLKYYLLKVDPKKRMLFNPEESIELNGHTGPFIQYTHARICSLLTKAGSYKTSSSAIFGDLEKDILKLILEYPEVIEEAAKTHSPSVVANYAYELVKTYNHFYQNVMILQEENEELKNARLTLSEMTVRTIASSLKLIGIDSPRKM